VGRLKAGATAWAAPRGGEAVGRPEASVGAQAASEGSSNGRPTNEIANGGAVLSVTETEGLVPGLVGEEAEAVTGDYSEERSSAVWYRTLQRLRFRAEVWWSR